MYDYPLYFSITFGSIIFSGILLNLILITIIPHISPESRLTKILLVNQVSLGLGTSLSSTGILFSNLVWKVSESNVYRWFICHAWYSQALVWTIASLATHNLVCMAIDRYLAIVHPNVYRCHTGLLVVTSYAYSLVMALVLGIPFSLLVSYTPNDKTCQPVPSAFNSTSFLNFHGYVCIVLFYLFPVGTMLMSHLMAIRWIRKRDRASVLQLMVFSWGNKNLLGLSISLDILITVTHAYGVVIQILSVYDVVHFYLGSVEQSLDLLLINTFCVFNPIIIIAWLPVLRRRLCKGLASACLISSCSKQVPVNAG